MVVQKCTKEAKNGFSCDKLTENAKMAGKKAGVPRNMAAIYPKWLELMTISLKKLGIVQGCEKWQSHLRVGQQLLKWPKKGQKCQK